ncbi:hypothetical protein NG798_10110 [Ancylothrix sp. C2]|uniref:hypothetical protein n=1 Tax=Ancylothrix sp. D3o TaxID=2953691 RepID=UPI0021BB961C|nr:hypothetical protein [Ancylothrix sp. D3o]MCT7950139.1 hypothetical protein [Ancylothrix sp. D3o]
MISLPLRKFIAPLMLSVLLLVTACSGAKEPSRWDGAQQESTQRGAKVQPANPSDRGASVPGVPNNAPAGKAVSGGSFNKYFPASSGGYTRVFSQEKAGFAEAKLNQGGKNVAVLSVNDLAANPTALSKYQTSNKTIAGYPAAVQGNGTSVLVGGRYQVKVQSRDTSFTADDREDWLQKFNLSGISTIKK